MSARVGNIITPFTIELQRQIPWLTQVLIVHKIENYLKLYLTMLSNLKQYILLSHFGDFDCDSTSNWTYFSFLSLRAVSTQSPRICSGVANEQKFFNLFKFFSICCAVSAESYCNLRGFAVHLPSNWRRLRCEPMETAARLWRMHGDCAVNQIKCNGNDVVHCYVINFILQNNERWRVNDKDKINDSV